MKTTEIIKEKNIEKWVSSYFKYLKVNKTEVDFKTKVDPLV